MTRSPSDEELLQAITQLRPLHPHLGRPKFLLLLKDTHSWALSEGRLKKVLDHNNLNAKPEKEINQLPRDEDFQIIVKAIFQDFRDLEREFLLALKPSQLRGLGCNCSESIQAAAHLSHHIEILLTLKEVKPCTLFQAAPGQHIYNNMVEQCLKPLFKQYDLARYGFRLEVINHPSTEWVVKKGFQGVWILADTRSNLWSDINNMFLIANPDIPCLYHLGEVLGYPVDSDNSDDAKFRVLDRTERMVLEETEEADGRELCCVAAYEFYCNLKNGAEHFEVLRNHFERCYEAAKSVGTYLWTDKRTSEWMDQLQRQYHVSGGKKIREIDFLGIYEREEENRE